MPTAHPKKLERAGETHLLIEWSDGQRRRYSFRELREACPCATCREKRQQDNAGMQLLPVLSAAETQPLQIKSMSPVGQYAYSIDFSDGHDTGIYTFEHLRTLGEAVDAA